jgi:predicted alpha/beta-fold hydrolase
MRELGAYVQRKKQLFSAANQQPHLTALEQLGPLDKMRTFWDFDGLVTAPLHGYADADDYYRRASSRYFLPAIKVPTLLIQAADDPFVFRHSVPELNELAAGTELELHAHGGHVGFIDGTLRKPGLYLERRIPQWLTEQITGNSQTTKKHLERHL